MLNHTSVLTDLNLIDWGSRNLVCVALGGQVFLWNADSGLSRSSICLQWTSGISQVALKACTKWSRRRLTRSPVFSSPMMLAIVH
jgi:hypothetical protein